MSYHSMLTAGKQNATCVNHSQESLTSDGQGGYTKTWVVMHFDLLCRFNSLSTTESERIYEKLGVPADFKVYLEHVSGIKEGDKLTKLDDGREFSVQLVMDWDEDQSMLKLAVKELGRLE